MEIERTCNVCQDEALFFCRMCSTHYCPEHLCLHLNVAWESNTWTQRNKGDYDETFTSPYDEGCSDTTEERESRSLDSPRVNSSEATPKSLLNYTESQLQAQYNFYLSQARRIRTELERRSIFTPGSISSERIESRTYTTKQRPKRVHRPPKSATHAISVLSDNIRSGNIDLERLRSLLGLEVKPERRSVP